MVDKVFRKNPRLYAEIVALNSDNRKILELCEEALVEMKARIEKGGAEGLREWLEA
jgi:prephenate dehydrogenase